MFITRECDYAVRIVRALSGGLRLSVNEICEKEEIPAPFTYKILKKLQRAQIVKAYRGVNGGYTLYAELERLTLFDVYYAVDPGLCIAECLDPSFTCVKDKAGDDPCKIRVELEDIQKELWDLLKRKPVSEMIAEA